MKVPRPRREPPARRRWRIQEPVRLAFSRAMNRASCFVARRLATVAVLARLVGIETGLDGWSPPPEEGTS